MQSAQWHEQIAFEMCTRRQTLLVEEIRETQHFNEALKEFGKKEMGRKDSSLQHEQSFRGKKIWSMFMER